MSVEENTKVLHVVIEEVWNRGNLALVSEIISPEYRSRNFQGLNYAGPDGFKQIVTAVRFAFPDSHHLIEDVIAEGDRLAVRLSWTGTFTGKMEGVLATGKEFKISGGIFYRYKNAKCVEAVAFWDRVTMFQQLGISDASLQTAVPAGI